MHPTIQHAALTNFVTDLGEDGMFFYTLTKYWMANHTCRPEEWEELDDLEVFLEFRSYTGPAPRTRNVYKYTLTPSQYALTLYEVENNGPKAAHAYIERMRPSWLATTLT